jgi:hypothetical protein
LAKASKAAPPFWGADETLTGGESLSVERLAVLIKFDGNIIAKSTTMSPLPMLPVLCVSAWRVEVSQVDVAGTALFNVLLYVVQFREKNGALVANDFSEFLQRPICVHQAHSSHVMYLRFTSKFLNEVIVPASLAIDGIGHVAKGI